MAEISVFSPAGRSPGIDGFAFHMVPGSGGIQCQLPLKRSRFDPRSRPEGVEIREMLLSTAAAGKNCFNGFTVSHWQMGMRFQPQQSGMLPAPDGIYPQSACQTPLACKKWFLGLTSGERGLSRCWIRLSCRYRCRSSLSM